MKLLRVSLFLSLSGLIGLSTFPNFEPYFLLKERFRKAAELQRKQQEKSNENIAKLNKLRVEKKVGEDNMEEGPGGEGESRQEGGTDTADPFSEEDAKKGQ